MIKKLLIALLLINSIGCYARSMKRPQQLHAGDTIAIIAPASCLRPATIDSAAKVLKTWGLVPVIGTHAKGRKGSYSGSVRNRLADLKWAFESPNIKAVISTRGGYGSYEVLKQLPKGYFSKHPKWMVGYSDITAIHLAMANDGVMSIHGHMCGHLAATGGTDTTSVKIKEILFGFKPTYVVDRDSLNHNGSARGVLLGGNLSLVNDVHASQLDPIYKGKNIILFLEDVGENIHSVKRILYHLALTGALPRVKGLIVGQFTEYKPNEDYQTMAEMIADVVKDYDIPMAFNFPVGHVTDNFPMIQGSKVVLNVTDERTTLTFE